MSNHLISNKKTSNARALNASSILYRSALASVALLAAASSGDALAVGVGENVVSGSATINRPTDKDLVVDVHTSKAIINWWNLDVLHGESARFNQIDKNSLVLNRIGDGNPTKIFGSLSANGKLILVNPNGVFFGAGAKVDVAGLIASSADISNENFNAGKLKFDRAGKADASIINQGSITARDGGLVALVAPSVTNDGVIQANAGTVALGAGETATIDMYGDGLYSFAVGSNGKSVSNTGKIVAQGGKVLLTANAAKDVVTSVVNNTGVIEASSARSVGGVVILDGGAHGKVRVGGKINASGKKGGRVTVTGKAIELAGASIDASGATEGGSVRIGGDYQGTGSLAHADTVAADKGTFINVSALESGNAGSSVIWSDNATQFAGSILATAGAAGGNGGLAEVSSKGTLNYSGVADVHGVNGLAGKLLLDPVDIVVDAILAAATEATLNMGGDVEIATAGAGVDLGNITVDHVINWFGIGNLTLNADNNIIVNQSITSAQNADWGLAGGIRLNAGNDVLFNNAALSTQNGNITVTGAKVTLMNSVISALRGDIIINNSGAFYSDAANSVYNSNLWGGKVSINQTDAGSIQNVVDAIGGSGWSGATINLNAGTWDEQVYINKGNFTLTGHGEDSVISAPKELAHYTTASGIDSTSVIFVDKVYNTTVRSLNVEGENRANSGVVFNSSYATADNVHVENLAGDGFLLDDAANSRVQNSLVTGTTADYAQGLGNGIHAIRSNGALIADNGVYSTQWDGIRLDGGDAYQVTGNQIGNIQGIGIYAAGVSNTEISRNLVQFSNLTTVDFAGITVLDGSSNLTLENNNIYNVGNGSGIRLSGVTGHNAIIGNDMDSLTQDGIQANNVDNLEVSYNSVRNAGRDGIHLDTILDANVFLNTISNVDRDGINGSNLRVSTPENDVAGETNISDNIISVTGRDGIHLDTLKGNVQNASLTNNEIFDVAGHGIFARNLAAIAGTTFDVETEASSVLSYGQSLIAGNHIYRTGEDGIHLEHVENTYAVDNLIHDICFNGIFAFDVFTNWATSTVIAANDIFRTGINGIRVDEVENAYIVDNNIHEIGEADGLEHHSMAGMMYEEMGGDWYGEIYDGIVATNLYRTPANPAEDPLVGQAWEGSIYDGDAGFSVIAGNDVYNVRNDAIHVRGSGNTIINDNDLFQLGGDGIDAAYLYADPDTSITDISLNRVHDLGGNGIVLDLVENANVTNNNIHDLGVDGIHARNLYATSTEEAYRFSRVNGNVVNGVGVHGIHIEDIQNGSISGNTVSSTGDTGILVVNQPAYEGAAGNGSYDNAYVIGNVVHDVAVDGIQLIGLDSAQISYNVAQRVGQAALSVIGSAATQIFSNTLTDGRVGLYLSGSDMANIHTNTLTDNGVGMLLENSNNATLGGDLFTGNTLGIALDNSSFARLDDENLSIPAGGMGLVIRNGSANTIVKDSSFTGGDIAILIDGGNMGGGEDSIGGGSNASSMQFEGNGSVFTGNNQYFVLQNGAMLGDEINASAQTFDGTRASDFTPAQLAAAEARTTDADDSVTIGNVFYKFFPIDPEVPVDPEVVPQVPSITPPAAFDFSVLDDFQTNRRNVYRRGNFSYAGRAINIVSDPIEPGAFGPLNLNLSLLGSQFPATPVNVANQFASLAPAAGGNSPEDLANLSPAAGGNAPQQTASLAPAGGSCANSFLGDGYVNGFQCSLPQ